jgi:HEAT repeat protein
MIEVVNRICAAVVLMIALGMVLMADHSAVLAAVPGNIQRLYDKGEYQKALDEIAKLDGPASSASDVQRLKVRSLLKLGNPKEAFEEYDRLERASNRDELQLLREVALGFIIVMLKDMREQMRGAAFTALKEADSEDVIPYFEDGLSDGSGPVRMLAVEGLSRTEAGRRSPKLRGALDDQAGLVKARVVKALGQSTDPSVVPLLETASKDELPTVRIAAYGALLRHGRKEAWDALRQGADAVNPEDRAEALRVMADLKDRRAMPLMLESLTYKQPSVRGAAARGLGHLGRREVREDIERLLRDPVPAVREAAASALADLADTASVPALNLALQDGAFSVRAAAAAALLQLGQPFETVAPTVRALAQQSDTGARASAAQALGKATKPNVAGALSFLESLAADPLPGPKIVAIRSLGRLGDQSVLSLMKEALRDQNEAVRTTAGGAILRILQNKRLSKDGFQPVAGN